MRPLLALITPFVLAAGDAATAAPVVDPTAAVVAEGRFTYRQRDVDALVAIARRHAGRGWQSGDDAATARMLATALPAREAFAAALGGLPASLTGPGRDAFVLDLLAYEADPAVSAPAAMPAPAAPAAPAVAPAAGPVIVRLPQPTLRRTIATSSRTLTVGVALLFPDQTTADRFQSRVEVFQDALIGALGALPDAQFQAPDHALLKDQVERAFRLRIPDLPPGAVLIPALETGP
jgi:hypothetical protein